MNKWIGSGRLTRDAEVRYTNGGDSSTAIARVSIACDRRFRRENDDQTADFIPLVAFGKTAVFLEKYGYKGTKFNIVGRIQTGSYTNKDGVKVYTTDIIVEEIEFAESKAAGNSAAAGSAPAPSPASGDGFMNIPDGIDEDLPFN